MKYYTKQWQQLFEYLGTIDMYEPIIDKEYTDQEIADLYEDMMDKYIEEERIAYDEPPTMGDLYELDPEDFDPDDYIIGDIDADGSESNLRNPASYEEFMEYQKKEYEFEMREYESRPPFDEEEAREDFEEEYRDASAFRGLEDYSHIWLIWQFSKAQKSTWSPTVRPPRLGGNRRMGVFATRSPFRPNPIGLSSVKLERIITGTP